MVIEKRTLIVNFFSLVIWHPEHLESSFLNFLFQDHTNISKAVYEKKIKNYLKYQYHFSVSRHIRQYRRSNGLCHGYGHGVGVGVVVELGLECVVLDMVMMMKVRREPAFSRQWRLAGLVSEEGPSSRFSRIVLFPRQLRPATELLEPVF
ncbi:hypothetical protein Plhal710r2_c006g0028551 [Plasmopara halstedii]